MIRLETKKPPTAPGYYYVKYKDSDGAWHIVEISRFGSIYITGVEGTLDASMFRWFGAVYFPDEVTP